MIMFLHCIMEISITQEATLPSARSVASAARTPPPCLSCPGVPKARSVWRSKFERCAIYKISFTNNKRGVKIVVMNEQIGLCTRVILYVLCYMHQYLTSSIWSQTSWSGCSDALSVATKPLTCSANTFALRAHSISLGCARTDSGSFSVVSFRRFAVLRVACSCARKGEIQVNKC